MPVKSYNFPPITIETTTERQSLKIQIELDEAYVARKKWGQDPSDYKLRKEYLIELIDVIHACETALRHEDVDCEELLHLMYIVEKKNRVRGYYDEKEAPCQ